MIGSPSSLCGRWARAEQAELEPGYSQPVLGVRGGKAMIATWRWRLITVPGRLIRHAHHLVLRLPPGHSLPPEVLARLRTCPVAA